ncbi:Nramp family divalent metal transporter [Thermopirellula anaerolimosa]
MSDSTASSGVIPPDSCVQSPPTRFGRMLLSMGPGMIIAAAVVGSGELIATTRTGAEAGFALLWLIIIGCVSKVFVQVELGRHAVVSGRTTMAALNSLPGPRVRVHWMLWYWVVMFVVSLAQLGGIAHGVGQALAIALPLDGSYQRLLDAQDEWARQSEAIPAEVGSRENDQPSAEPRGVGPSPPAKRPDYGSQGFAWTDDILWAAIICLGTIPILVLGRYGTIQWVCTILVAAFTVATVWCVIALQFRPEWAVSLGDLISGLSFRLPSGIDRWAAFGTALATFGIIGMGTNELITYPYWCLEKGYAKHAGRPDHSPDWTQRARGWMRVIQWDAFLSMIVYTFATAAFYLLGAAVLFRAGLKPEGSRLIVTLSEMYAPVFGTWTQVLFLAGAVAVLYSTFFSATAGHARVASDALRLFLGRESHPDQPPPTSWVVAFSVGFPLFSLATCLLYREPVSLIIASGFMQAIMLPMLAGAAIFFRYRACPADLRPGRWWDVFLWISAAALFAAGIAGAFFAIRPWIMPH